MPQNQPLYAGNVDQLVLIAVPDEQAGELGKKLAVEGYRFTLISASNGFLPSGITCLMMGIYSGDHDHLMRLVEQICKTKRRYIPTTGNFGPGEGLSMNMIEAEIGNTLIYVLQVKSFETL